MLDEARTRSRSGFEERIARLRATSGSIAKNALAAGAAWVVATDVVGHPRPFFAPIAAVVSMGTTVGARSRRAIELSIGVALGILVADLLVHGIGRGWASLILIVALAMIAAILLGGGTLLVQQAATSAVLVATLNTGGNPFSRSIDALIGGGVALVVNLLLFPAHPIRILRREAAPVLTELAGVLDDIAVALAERERELVLAALRRARAIDPLMARFREAVAVGGETARFAPPRRADRAHVDRYAVAANEIDMAVRNVRVLARGTLRAVETGDHVPAEAINAIRDLAEAVRALGSGLPDGAGEERAREHALLAAAGATISLESTNNLSVSVIVGQVRSTAVDLLRGLGMEADEAREAVRAARAKRQ